MVQARTTYCTHCTVLSRGTKASHKCISLIFCFMPSHCHLGRLYSRTHAAVLKQRMFEPMRAQVCQTQSAHRLLVIQPIPYVLLALDTWIFVHTRLNNLSSISHPQSIGYFGSFNCSDVRLYGRRNRCRTPSRHRASVVCHVCLHKVPCSQRAA
jgi:hypothetical protein